MTRRKVDASAKIEQLAGFSEDSSDQLMSNNQGVLVNDDQNSLKAGSRGPTLLEDFMMREKITHFDHERIPERVVHARGAGAHGFFQVYESMAEYSSAGFLQDPSVKTPVFVRFSTVVGSRGSTDLARDVRGFAVKFYTAQGNFDLVGNNIPVFFIQDAIKFPDLVHAVKPEPHNEIPQAASAHDTFWDFASLNTETAHMLQWVMSDRAIPRSLRMMEGFGVHTFRLVNAQGVSRFVKFHWKPLAGIASVAWDEAQKISGMDPDFHRADLWDAIESGAFPEWELCVQIVDEKDEHKFDFDLLDATKLIPEDLVPLQRIGKMTLNRNPDNFFAETEQVAFCVANIVPGIDFSDDPLMQGRIFSYLDTQLTRLGGPNFQEIPINRPLVPVHNNQRDGFMRTTINRTRTAYQPNSLGGGCPFQAGRAQGGFFSSPERIDASKIRERNEKFMDHFSQAALFFNSQSESEKAHIIDAFTFELSKVETEAIRARMLNVLNQVDPVLAKGVSDGLAMEIPTDVTQINHAVPADVDPARYQPKPRKTKVGKSPALSIELSPHNPKNSIATRKVAILTSDGVDENALAAVQKALLAEGAVPCTIAPHPGQVVGDKGGTIPVRYNLVTVASVLFDAVYVPGGAKSVAALSANGRALHFVTEAFKHCKPVGATGEGTELLARSFIGIMGLTETAGVITAASATAFAPTFIEAMKTGRFWEREQGPQVPS